MLFDMDIDTNVNCTTTIHNKRASQGPLSNESLYALCSNTCALDRLDMLQAPEPSLAPRCIKPRSKEPLRKAVDGLAAWARHTRRCMQHTPRRPSSFVALLQRA